MAGRSWGTWRGTSRGSALVLRLVAGSSRGPSSWSPRSGGHGLLGISQASQPPSGPIPASFIKQIKPERCCQGPRRGRSQGPRRPACSRGPQTGSSAETAGVRVLRTEVRALYIRVLPRGIVVSGGARFPATADAPSRPGRSWLPARWSRGCKRLGEELAVRTGIAKQSGRQR